VERVPVAKPKSERASRRAAERAQQKLTRQRVRLAALAVGGAPERPADVDSASVVESRAESEPCLVCGGPVGTVEHRAETHDDRRLRVAVVSCRRCGAKRAFYFRIGTTLPS
jgi:hypothetical protein